MTEDAITRIRSARALALAAALAAIASMVGHTTPLLAATAIEYGLIAALI
jgi:hypothetical protein